MSIAPDWPFFAGQQGRYAYENASLAAYTGSGRRAMQPSYGVHPSAAMDLFGRASMDPYSFDA